MLELADGRRLLDAISSWWTILHGHARPELIEAMTRQAQQLDHVLFAGFTHEPAVELAERLVELAPGPLSRVFFSDDGSTAVEVALKAAYQSWVRRGEPSRTTFIALKGAYHGDTFGAMSVGEADPFFAEFAPFLFHVVQVDPTPESLAAALEELPGRVAGVILEPLVQGAAGMVMHGVDFLQRTRALCDEHDTLLIADEVMTGFGRTGAIFACSKAGIEPDLLCLAKGLTGGIFPLSVTLASEEIYAAFLADDRSKAFFHGHTFTGHPIGCAMALASLDILEKEDTPGRLDRNGAQIESLLRESLGRREDLSIRRCGGIVAVEIAQEESSGYLAPIGDRLRSACRAREDVLLRPLGPILYAMPPSCLDEEQCATVARAMSEVLTSATMPDTP